MENIGETGSIKASIRWAERTARSCAAVNDRVLTLSRRAQGSSEDIGLMAGSIADAARNALSDLDRAQAILARLGSF